MCRRWRLHSRTALAACTTCKSLRLYLHVCPSVLQHFHLSHNYADSISVVGGCAFVQVGVVGDCNRDGHRHSRVLKGPPQTGNSNPTCESPLSLGRAIASLFFFFFILLFHSFFFFVFVFFSFRFSFLFPFSFTCLRRLPGMCPLPTLVVRQWIERAAERCLGPYFFICTINRVPTCRRRQGVSLCSRWTMRAAPCGSTWRTVAFLINQNTRIAGDGEGYQLFTLDHEDSSLRLDLAHRWVDAAAPVPVYHEEELLCDPNSVSFLIDSQPN